MLNSGKQQLLAFLLILVVLFLTPKYMEFISPPQPENTSLEFEEKKLTDSKQSNNFEYIQKIEDSDDALRSKQYQDFKNEIVFTVETPKYTAEISNSGGGTIRSFILKDYMGGYLDDGSYNEEAPVSILLPEENSCAPCLALRDHSSNKPAFFDRPFTTEITNGQIFNIKEGESKQFDFTFKDNSGNIIEKSLIVNGDFYHFNYTVNTESLNDGAFTKEIAWTKALRPTEKNKDDDITESGSVIWQVDDKESVNQNSPDKLYLESLDGRTDWASIKTKYFIASIIPDNKGIYGSFEAENKSFGDRDITPGYKMYIGHSDSEHILSGKLYLGPQDVTEMKKTGSNIEEAMNWGYFFIRPISKFILKLLKFLHNPYTGFQINYGIVLILFAFLVRLLTGPLTKKATVSNQKIQQLQPQIKKLQAKYKDDPMKLNKETMALWKKHSVNPLGGCLPIIIQMPLLFALFVTFRTTIEFRGEPFFLWITDLSQPDIIVNLPFSIPIYGAHIAILPLFMGITMFFQQKFSSATMDSSQKPIMYMMTGFFFLIFNSFPSGLNLYYATSNILNIIQQWNLKKTTKLSTT